MRDALIFAGLTIGAVAALFPTGGNPAPTVPATEQQAGAAHLSATEQPGAAASGGAVELRRAGDGHFYAPVTVGSRPVTMLIDTGASVVALTGADARAAGIAWNAGDLKVVAQGAGGPVNGVTVTVEAMRLGSHEARKVRTVIIPEGLPVSLLGQSFLKDVEPVRIEKDRMILGGG